MDKPSVVFMNKLKDLIEKYGISARKLSLRSGLSHATISHMLKRNAQPTLDTATAIANTVGMCLAEFLGDAGKEHGVDECFRRVQAEWKKQRAKP